MRAARPAAIACAVGFLGGVLAPVPAAADSIRDRQWHLAALRISQAHEVSQGDGVLVAVTDTGVDDRHAELAGAVIAGKEFGEQPTGNGKADTDGHGTAMAGLIAGRGLPNGGGVLGIAPRAIILPVQTLHSEFGGSPVDLADGITWAVSQGAKVICVAAVTGEYPEVRVAIERAVKADVVVVAGVGNTPKSKQVGFPAKLPGVVAVAGTDRDGNHAAISATGPEVVLAAPAVEIVSIGAFGKYVVGEGTSDSTAIVAGVVALVRAKFPELSAAEVVRRLTATAVDRGKPGRDEEFGFGIVDPVAALTAEVPAGGAQVTGVPEAGRERGPTGGGGGVGWVVVAVVAVGGVVGWWVRRRTR
ncbi:type VII secretion-associated serine protease mycosin [Dactylosporangium maewongense]|uniref:Type VII secretion-associated serine protease mycosin n=1 Tax=Dactylosporangium maewongense TaxID=634393 RepID=A0ABN2AEX3_9ACTN